MTKHVYVNPNTGPDENRDYDDWGFGTSFFICGGRSENQHFLSDLLLLENRSNKGSLLNRDTSLSWNSYSLMKNYKKI